MLMQARKYLMDIAAQYKRQKHPDSHILTEQCCEIRFSSHEQVYEERDTYNCIDIPGFVGEQYSCPRPFPYIVRIESNRVVNGPAIVVFDATHSVKLILF